MAVSTVRTLLASAARTTNGVSDSMGLAIDGASKVAIGVNITAFSGVSPTLDAVVQWSHDGGTSWLTPQPADSFTQAITAQGAIKVFDVKAPMARVVYSMTGTTPSFTFTVTAVGV